MGHITALDPRNRSTVVDLSISPFHSSMRPGGVHVQRCTAPTYRWSRVVLSRSLFFRIRLFRRHGGGKRKIVYVCCPEWHYGEVGFIDIVVVVVAIGVVVVVAAVVFVSVVSSFLSRSSSEISPSLSTILYYTLSF